MQRKHSFYIPFIAHYFIVCVVKLVLSDKRVTSINYDSNTIVSVYEFLQHPQILSSGSLFFITLVVDAVDETLPNNNIVRPVLLASSPVEGYSILS
jgi:hypothetical protein